MKKLEKWWEVFSGDVEQRIFTGKDGKSGLVRHHTYVWRSIDSLVKESGESRETVEKMINKYAKRGLILNNPKNAEQWGFWSRVAPDMAHQTDLSFSDEDKKKRIDKVSGVKK